MLLLGIDTSAAVSACVHDGDRVLADASQHDPRRHAELLAPMVSQVLGEAGVDRSELTAVVVGVGPGPFTGLRVGLATARVLGMALGLPVHGICSLDALAAEAVKTGAGAATGVVVATDARRKEVYWARYDVIDGRPRRVDGPHVGAPGTVDRRDLPVVGRGALPYPQDLPGPSRPLDARASFLAGIAVRALEAGSDDLLPPDPLYLRRPDATEPAGRKPVLQ